VNPLAVLFALFLVIPLVEIYVLIQVGSAVGALSTIALCVGTALAGAALLRTQGVSTLLRVQRTLDAGEVPALELLEGAVLLLAGAMLLTPGFVTDAVGFACLVPALRRAMVLRWLERRVVVGTIHGGGRGGPRGPGTVIEGEFEQEDQEKIR